MAKSAIKQKKKKQPQQVEPSEKKKNIGFFQRPLVHILIIVAVGFLIYSNTFHSPFLYDDLSFIVGNPAIKDFHYFKNPWQVLTLPTIAPNVRTQFITRILANFTFALNYAAHGLNVTGYHMFNLIVHLVNAVLVYSVVLVTFRTPLFSARFRLQDDSDSAHYQSIIALFSALIFVSHPVQTQAVTYITQRFASFVTTFYLLSLVLYVRSRLSESSAQRFVLYAACIMSAICSMLTKENAFTLPVVIALYEATFFDGKIKKRILYLLPLIATMLIIPLLLLKVRGILTDISAIDKSKIGGIHTIRWDYLIIQFTVIVTYIRLLFFPVNQNLDYDFPISHSFWEPSVFLSFLFLLMIFGCSVYCFYLSKRTDMKDRHELRIISFGIFWFLITLSVESSVVALDNVIYEHRVYLPSVMPIIAFATLIFRFKNRTKTAVPLAGKVAVPILVVIVLTFSGATYARNRVWQSGISLWEDAVKKSPYKARVHANLGNFYHKNGRLEDASREYQAAIELYPGSASAHVDLFAAAHTNLGVIYGKQGRFKDAERELRTALTIDPDFAEAHLNMGVLYEKLGRMQEATEEFRTALNLDPYNALTHTNLGVIYTKQGRFEEAERELQTAIRLRPDLAEPRNVLQIIQSRKK